MEAELIEAARFYEQRVPLLGAQFLDAADLAITAILEAPHRWSIVEAGVRQYLMPRCPYSIYYRVLPDHIRILAFKHHSRHPSYCAIVFRNKPRQKASENQGSPEPVEFSQLER